MHHATIVGTLLPVSKRATRVMLVTASVIFTALCAQVAIPLWFTPVPLTGQTFSVLLTALLLGSQMATWSMGLYLLCGAIGLPVFAGATGGLVRLMGPTGGYLLGFLLAVYLVGRLAERGWDRRLSSCLLALCLGELAIYISGLLWLSHFVPSGQLLAMGFYPFIPGDLIKIGLVTVALPSGWKLLNGGGELS